MINRSDAWRSVLSTWTCPTPSNSSNSSCDPCGEAADLLQKQLAGRSLMMYGLTVHSRLGCHARHRFLSLALPSRLAARPSAQNLPGTADVAVSMANSDLRQICAADQPASDLQQRSSALWAVGNPTELQKTLLSSCLLGL